MSIKNTIWNILWEQEWNIGFFRLSLFDNNIPEITWLRTDYKGGWFADPFILNERDNHIEVLVEEYNYVTGKGRIDLLTVNSSDYSLEDIKVLLDTGYHLSYPAVFRQDDRIYIYPENSEESVLKIYEYNEASRTLENPVTILEDNVVDAIIRYDSLENAYYLFATKYGSLQANDELLIYRSDLLTGEYRLYSKLSYGNFGARGAGDWIEMDDCWIRPSQDGSDLNQYGKGIILSKVSRCDGYGFVECDRIYPSSRIYPLGIHTINRLGSLYVVDGLKYKRPLLGRLSWSLRNRLQRPHK